MASKPISLGIIGCGDIVVSWHLPVLKACAEVAVKAVCDSDQERAIKASQHCYEAFHTTSYRDILENEEIEAVLVCTPPWITPEITREALLAGKDVLCEKPMATSLKKACEVAEAEKRSGRLLQVGFTYRHGPLMDGLKDWISSGRLGRPLQIRLSQFDEIWDPEGHPEHYNRIMKTLEHGPPCLHDGAHAADHLAFLTASFPVRVTARGLTTRSEFSSANYNAALIEFSNGDQANYEVGWFFPKLPQGELQILGPKGMAYLDRSAGEAILMIGDTVERIHIEEDHVQSCFQAQLGKFISSLKSRTIPVPGSREGIASLRLTLAMAQAMQSKETVTLHQEESI